MESYKDLGIVICIFYIPAVIVAGILLVQHGRPRMAWITLFLFSCARFASGIVMIPWAIDQSNKGVAAATEILINVGVVPLLLSTIGQIRIIHAYGFPKSETSRKAIALTRAFALVGISLLVVGAVLISISTDAKLLDVGLPLTKSGYFILLFALVGILVLEVVLLWYIPRSASAIKICFTAVAVALPFQIIRLIYALLGLFGVRTFSPLSGSIAVLVGMCLIMEYVAVILYCLAGWFLISRLPSQNTTSTA